MSVLLPPWAVIMLFISNIGGPVGIVLLLPTLVRQNSSSNAADQNRGHALQGLVTAVLLLMAVTNLVWLFARLHG